MSQRIPTSSIVAWEQADGFGAMLRSLAVAVASLLLRPVDFFRTLKSAGGVPVRQRVIRALVFALLLGYLKLAFDVVNIFWLKHLSSHAISPELRAQMSFVTFSAMHSPFFVLRPLLVLAVTLVFVSAGIKLVLGFDKSLFPVFFIVCYKSAADIFYALPVVGGLFASVWGLALILIGVRELYGVPVWRAVTSAVILPFLLISFLALSVGPALNRTLIKFYPELRSQVMRLNDMTAYMYTLSIVNAAKTYKQELGFYPVNLDVLKKYISRSVTDDVSDPNNASGYVYSYIKQDESHFTVQASPVKMNASGRFVFYSDETGQVRLGGPSGAVIRDTQELEMHEQAPGSKKEGAS
ncbi:MAG: hypothetical protein ACE14U_01610 [Candidatus Velamenicoccus archaeovorus]